MSEPAQSAISSENRQETSACAPARNNSKRPQDPHQKGEDPRERRVQREAPESSME